MIDSLNDVAQMKIKEQKQILESSNQPLDKFIPMVKELLDDFLKSKLGMMQTNNRSSIITVKYILDGLDILENFSKWIQKALELEIYFREVETLSLGRILTKVL